MVRVRRRDLAPLEAAVKGNTAAVAANTAAVARLAAELARVADDHERRLTRLETAAGPAYNGAGRAG